MSDQDVVMSERDEIEMLVPFYVTGRISAADAARVDAFITRFPDFARSIEVARDERRAAVEVSEAAGFPSARATDAIFKAIADEPMPATIAMQGAARGLLDRVRDFFAAPTAMGVRYATVAAAAIILVQAAMLGTLWSGKAPDSGYETASGPQQPVSTGATALVAFQDAATAAQINRVLDGAGARIVEGPLKGGLYRVRFAADTKTDVERAIADLRAQADVVKTAVPGR